MDRKDMLINRMEDLALKAAKTDCALSKFLTPAEAAAIGAYFSRRREVQLFFDGGYDGAERVRAVFLNPDWSVYGREESFAALKIDIPARETAAIGHRDVLGALMGLGIKREAVGDIIESPLVVLCLPELGGFITENLTKAGRAHVKASPLRLDGLSARTESLKEQTCTVASLRLDAVLAAAFGLPRGKSAALVEAGRVSLNHVLCLEPAREVREGGVLSVRGRGRAKLLERGAASKKGRIFVRIGLYGG